jgi:HAD superfamily hydrolase (TIGR01509 family)
MNQKFAILFDMDGVIVDSNPTHTIALKQFCLKHGYNLTEQHLREKIYGRANKDWIPNLFGEIPEKLRQEYADEKEALFREIYHDIKPLDGLVDFLKLLDEAGIKRAIATSAPRANVDFTLSKTHTASYFKVILDEAVVSIGKPHPEIYLKSAAALGMAPADCIVIEDSISGVKAGKAAGCKVIGVTTTHSEEELAGIDMVIRDFVGLHPMELFKRLF